MGRVRIVALVAGVTTALTTLSVAASPPPSRAVGLLIEGINGEVAAKVRLDAAYDDTCLGTDQTDDEYVEGWGAASMLSADQAGTYSRLVPPEEEPDTGTARARATLTSSAGADPDGYLQEFHSERWARIEASSARGDGEPHDPLVHTECAYRAWAGQGDVKLQFEVAETDIAVLTVSGPEDPSTGVLTELRRLPGESTPGATLATLASLTGWTRNASVEVTPGRYEIVANYGHLEAITGRAAPALVDVEQTVAVDLKVGTPMHAPVAVADQIDARGGPTATDVVANDTDADGDPLAVASFTQPRYGSSGCGAASCLYSPAAGAYVSDRFTYTVSDGALTDTAAVTVLRSPTRIRPTVAASATPRRDRSSPYRYVVGGRLNGRLQRVAAVCHGTVALTAYRGTRRLARVTASLRPDCTFRRAIAFNRARLGTRRSVPVALEVRWLGTRILAANRTRIRVYAN